MAPDPLSLRLLQAVEALSLRVESHLDEVDLSHPLLAPIPEEKAKRAANLETELLGAIDDSEIIASALNQLQNVRDLVFERRQRVQRAKAGITALPPEVLQIVFLALVDDHILDPVHRPFCHSAHVLSHVCSEWRQIAIQQSALWHKIDLGLFNENQFALKIERAGPIQPLTLALRVDDVHVLDLADMIQDYAERWEAIDIFASSCSRSDLSQVFNGLGLSKFSSLRHFSVVGSGRTHGTISREMRFLGPRNPEKQSRHPLLSYLSTSHVRFADFQDIVDTLTTLTTKAAGYPARTWLTVLTRAEMLRYLTITDENLSSTSDPVVTAPITLPHLEALTLSECSPRAMRFMFRAIHAPELLTVSIDFPFTGRLEGKHARADFEESLDHFVRDPSYNQAFMPFSSYIHPNNSPVVQCPERGLKWRA
jgi:hypothetical protein